MVKTEKIPEGYRATEAGILPVDWQVKRLSEVATELTERAGQDKYETVSISAGIGFVNQAEKFGKELSGKQYEKYIVLHQGDFSYNKGNSKTSPQGCIYRLNDRETAAVPNVFESFRIEDQNADYYEQLFLSGFLNKQLYSKINRGVRDDGLLNLTGKDFYSCAVPVPPIAEQKKIAEVLSCCDRVIELKQQLIAELQRLKSGFLQAMFPAKGHSEPVIRFPEFSDAWEQRKLGDISEIKTGPFGSTLHADDYVSDGTPIITTEHFKTGTLPRSKNGLPQVSDADYKRLTAYTLDDGDIVFSRVGSVDINALITPFQSNWLFSGRVLRVRPQTDISSQFLHTRLETESIKADIRARAVGQTMPSINTEILKITPLVLPTSAAEQEQIGSYFAAIDHLITLHQRELEETKKKKKSLAKLLLTGSVRVPT